MGRGITSPYSGKLSLLSVSVAFSVVLGVLCLVAEFGHTLLLNLVILSLKLSQVL